MHNTSETNLVLRQDVLSLNKGELQIYGQTEARKLIEEGWANPLLLMVQSKKYLEVLTAFNKAMKEATIVELEKHSGNTTIGNSKIALGNTGQRLSYDDDPIYKELQEALKNRAEVLKIAHKQKDPFYDKDGIEIPKVSIKSHGEIVAKITL